MAEKKSFIIYASWATMIAEMPEAKAGQLIKAICARQTGKEYGIKDQMVNAVFGMIAEQMDADADSYAEQCMKRAEASAKGVEARKQKIIQQKQSSGTEEQMYGLEDQPNDLTEQPLDLDVQPHGSEKQPSGNRSQPHGSEKKPHGNDSQPHGNGTQPHGSEKQPSGNQMVGDNESESEYKYESESDSIRGVSPIVPFTVLTQVPQIGDEALDDLGVPEELHEPVSEWIENRDAKGRALTEKELKSFISQVKAESRQHGPSAVKNLIRETMGNGYMGVPWDRLDRARGKPKSGYIDRIDHRMDVVDEWAKAVGAFEEDSG